MIGLNTFYFAWADATETSFTSHMLVRDEELARFTITHEESKTPELSITIRNPRVGLLAPSRKRWAWLSWVNNDIVTPLFFGQLSGIPDDMFADAITLKFIARSLTYISDLQVAVEPLKSGVGYDPAFIDFGKRHDPMTILEGYSSSPHIDRITLVTSISDWLIGEDGNQIFGEIDDVPIGSVKMTVGQQPLTSVFVDCTVQWTQETRGYVDAGNKMFLSYAGDGMIGDWPKPGTALGGGWTAYDANAVDVFGVAIADTYSWSTSYQNNDTTHEDGDTMSVTTSVTMPTMGGASISVLLVNQFGLQDPFAVDIEGNPAPVNIPIVQKSQSSYVPLWQVNASMTMEYNAKRSWSEHVTFLLRSDLQPVFVNPTVLQDSEVITKAGIDVGAVIFDPTNWTELAGQAVAAGVICFPNNPTIPGQSIAQVCVGAGVTGLTEPLFQTVNGLETTDGTVTWSSLGTNAAPATSPDWSLQTEVAPGQTLIPRQPFFVPYASIIQGGLAQFPQVGAQVSFQEIVRAPDGSHQICQLAGTTDVWSSLETVDYPNYERMNLGQFPNFSQVWGDEITDGTVVWQSLGMSLPIGDTLYIAVQDGSGETGNLLPSFDKTLGAQTVDNGVTWQSLGPIELPVGGYPGNVTARSYFSTDRGQQSIKYLISLARARLRYRARAVTISFKCYFDRAVTLSCRQNATLFDPRLPGGQATGKIIKYTIEGAGKTGQFFGEITMGCSVGYGGVIHDDPGTGTYAQPGYMQPGYQQTTGTIVAIDPLQADVAYTPPAYDPQDDGLSFPLTYAQAVKNSSVHGSGLNVGISQQGILGGFVAIDPGSTPVPGPTTQPSPGALPNGMAFDPTSTWAALLQDQSEAIGTVLSTWAGSARAQFIASSGGGQAAAAQALSATRATQVYSVQWAVRTKPVWHDLQLAPVVNGPFSDEVNLTVSNLVIPQTINLEAPSAP